MSQSKRINRSFRTLILFLGVLLLSSCGKKIPNGLFGRGKSGTGKVFAIRDFFEKSETTGSSPVPLTSNHFMIMRVNSGGGTSYPVSSSPNFTLKGGSLDGR